MNPFKFIFLLFSFFLFACNQSENKTVDISQENQQKQTKNVADHGSNPANKHMHNTPVPDLIDAFENDERAATQKPDEVIALMGDISGKKILDIGAGSGYFTFRMADKGADVIAGDVNDEFLRYIEIKNAKSKRTQGSVTPKKLPFDSPVLTPNEIDHAIIVNTYHHIENRVDYFKKVLQGLKPGGMLMVVDFKKLHFHEKVDGPSYEMRIAAVDVEDELRDAGFDQFELNTTLLPFQYVLMAWKNDAEKTNKNLQNDEKFIPLKTEKINKKIANYRHNLSPEQIMREYYPLQPNPNEGKEKITVTSQEITKDVVVVTLIHDNLLDDSMRGKKIVMELHKKGPKWIVYSLKKNWKCWPNRGHQGWGIEFCG